PTAVAVGHHTRLMQLRDARVGGDGRDARIERYQRDLWNRDVVLPRHADLFLHGKKSRRREIDRQESAAVDGHVEVAVLARDRLAEFRVTYDRYRNARKRVAIARRDLAAENRDSFLVDRSRGHARLYRVGSAVKKCGG